MPAWTWSARKVEKKLFISAEECKCVLDAMQCMSFIPDAGLLKITTMEFPALYYLNGYLHSSTSQLTSWAFLKSFCCKNHIWHTYLTSIT